FAQFLEPVIIGNRFGQFPARPIDAGVKSAPPIAPQGTERHFSGRDRAWPGCQDINQIDQDPARRPKSLRDVVTKIFYTRLRGAVCFFCHAPSVTLDARLVGEAWPPRFLTKLVFNGVWRIVADLEILDHFLTQCGHGKLLSLSVNDEWKAPARRWWIRFRRDSKSGDDERWNRQGECEFNRQPLHSS